MIKKPLRRAILEFCNRYSTPILFARLQATAAGPRLVFGIAGADAAASLQALAELAFEDAFAALDVVDVSSADGVENLEHLFGQGGEWLFDPTLALRRAEAAAAAANALRGEGWTGRIGFEPKRRIFYLEDTAGGDWLNQFQVLLTEEAGRRGAEFVQPPQVLPALPGAGAPAVVDRLSCRQEVSAPAGRFAGFRFRLKPLIAAILGLGFLNMAEPAAAEPAVSELNGKLGASGGSLDGKGSGIGFGSVTAPLGHSFGLQLDAGAGSIDSNAYWGTGAHLFWRDPSVGLLGLTYSYHRWHDFDFGYLNPTNTPVVADAFMHRAGLEGEWYFSRFTLSGRGGYQDGTLNGDGYGQLKLKYYATDDLAVHTTADHFGGQNLIRGGVEYRPNLEVLSGLSLFAEGGYGSQDYAMGQAGIRLYFGKPTTLIGRDRRSDPEWLVPEETNAFVQQIKNMRRDQPYAVSTAAGGKGKD